MRGAGRLNATVRAIDVSVNNTVINVGGGRPVTVNKALDVIGQVTGRRLRIVHAPARPGDARHTGADGTRAEVLLRWRAKVDLATGLVNQAAWMAGSGQPQPRSTASPHSSG